MSSLARYPKLGDWLSIDPAGHVTIRSGKVEYGQGIRTAVAQLVGDELDLGLDQISVAEVDSDTSPDEGVTSGSRSTEETSEVLRRIAAEARAELVRRAAKRLALPAATLTTGNGCVRSAGGASLAYGELVDDDFHALELTGAAPIKPPSARTLVGRSVPRLDLPPKLAGQPVFIQDLAPAGLLHARVLRPPSYGATLAELDEAEVRALPGVRAVVRDGSFVGVVADREEQAIRALARLRRIARWDEPETLPASPRFLLEAATDDMIVRERLDAPERAAGGREIRAEFSRPYLAHASLAPSCAVAHVVAGRFTVWSHTQGPHQLRQELAKVLRVEATAVRVIHAEGAGGYGATGADDAALDAALLARALPGQPIRVQWTREDEFAWEPYGTAMIARLSARVDDDGDVVDWVHEVWGNGHRDRMGPDGPADVTSLLAARHLARPFRPSIAPGPATRSSGGGRNADPPYDFPNQRVVNHYVARTPLRVSALRSLGAHLNVFAAESFVDEIAQLAGQDPVAWRLRRLIDPRARAVLEQVASDAGWQAGASSDGSRGRGVGFARYKGAACYVAVVAEVEVGDDLRLTRVWGVVDGGEAVNPDGIANQAEGGILQAASWTLREEVRFDATRIRSRNWNDYPVLRFSDVPELHVRVLDRPDEPPLGVGEGFAGPVAAAIGNAVHQATGVRLRDMPFTRERILRAGS